MDHEDRLDLLKKLEDILEFMELTDTSKMLKENDSEKDALRREADLYTNLQTLKEYLTQEALR